MEVSESGQPYAFMQPPHWVNPTSDEIILERIKETDFSKKQADEGRDYCYFLDKIQYTNSDCNSEYIFLAYTLNEPSNLERASVNEVTLEDNENYHIHRISVLREGVLIDKLKDVQIKVLDGENQSSTGVLNNYKKINITIKDLHLFDIIILEDTRTKTFKEDEFIRKDFSKYVWISPDNYWAYGNFKFQFVNERQNPIAYKKVFFRDAEGNVIAPETNFLQKGERFVFEEQNFINLADTNREVSPYIDFATDSTWEKLSNYFAPIYHTIYNRNKVADFAPFLVEKLNALSTKEDQVRFAIEYVQNNINYIYNAHEMNGHLPQDPAVTFSNKQGDCKAKSVFLKVILDYLDISSEVVLVNYNADIHLDKYLPSLLNFNHVILKIYFKDQVYFVDPTIRDEFGLIENRGFIFFKYYLEIKNDQELQIQEPFQFDYFAIDEKVNFSVKNNVGDLVLTTIYKGNRANTMRRYFKMNSKQEIVDSWNNFLYHTLYYSGDRKGTDPRTIFQNASLEIINDDKNSNELTTKYTAKIEKAYYVDQQNKRFLMYFDRNMIKENAREYVHKDLLFWQNLDNEKYEISLFTDLNIDQKEKFTVQECDLKNRYFTYTCKKKILKNGATGSIEFRPTTNIEIEKQDFEAYRIAHHTIADSNFGLGVDIIEPSVFDKLKKMFG